MALRLYIFILLLTGCSLRMEAQKVPDPIVPGYIVNMKKDTVKGFVTVFNKLERQRGITFYTSDDVKTRKLYDATQIKGYGTEEGYFEAIRYSDGYCKGEMNFALTKVSGKMSLYDWYVWNTYAQNPGKRKGLEKIEDKDLTLDPLIRKNSYEVRNVNSSGFLNFKNGMSEFIRENRALAKRVEDKELKRDNLQEIVEIYNQGIPKPKRSTVK